MDTSSDLPTTAVDSLLGSRQPDRHAECPAHGVFTSRNIIGRVWSQCPDCEAAARAEREREEAADRQRFNEERHRRMMAAAQIPARFERCAFDNYVATTDGQRQALATARDFAEDFEVHAKRGATLILSGQPGTGKSHLTGAILRALMPTKDVRYTTCMDLIRAVRETWRKDAQHSESAMLGYFESLDLLAIDEVGMQYGTEGEQTILFDVLDRRYRQVKPTVLLTNLDKDGLKALVGERTFDRLRETARWVSFDWPSYRPVARKTAC